MHDHRYVVSHGSVTGDHHVRVKRTQAARQWTRVWMTCRPLVVLQVRKARSIKRRELALAKEESLSFPSGRLETAYQSMTIRLIATDDVRTHEQRFGARTHARAHARADARADARSRVKSGIQ